MTAKIVVAEDIRNQCIAIAQEVDKAFEGPWNQAKNAVAARRALAKLGVHLPDPAKEKDKHAKVMMALHYFGNASAVRQSALETKKAKATIAADYSAMV